MSSFVETTVAPWKGDRAVSETAAVIDGRAADAPGIIRPVSDPLLRETWPEAIYLRAHHTGRSYTIESPSAFPLTQRIAALRAAIETALRLSTRG